MGIDTSEFEKFNKDEQKRWQRKHEVQPTGKSKRSDGKVGLD